MSPDQTEQDGASSNISVAARFDRRGLMRGGAALGVGLAGVSALTRFGLAAQEDGTPTAATAGGATAGIVDAANAFLETLTDDEKATGTFAFDDTAQRQRWSNFPPAGFDRAGLRWGDLGQEAQEAWLAVMRVTLSEEGYDRVLKEWAADDALLATEGTGGGFGRDNYYVAMIGDPDETEPWQWQWGGHHVTVNATVVGEDLALTPSFIGAQPATYTDADGNEVKPLGDIEEDALALIGSLDADQLAAAVLGDAPIDLVLGPGQDGRQIQPEGLSGADMTDDQRTAFLTLIGHYTGLVNDAAAEVRRAEVEADFDETYLAWYGPTTGENAAYWRVSGPTIVVEYAPQGSGRGGIGGATDVEHIHGIYRDPTNDYGARYTGITIAS